MSFVTFYLLMTVFDLFLVLITFGVLIPFVPPFTQLKIHTKKSHVFASVVLSLIPVVNYIVGSIAVLFGIMYFVIEGAKLLNGKPLYGGRNEEDSPIIEGNIRRAVKVPRRKF